MNTRIDRHILSRMATVTGLVLFVLIFIFVLIDYSENSDDFTDRGAAWGQVWNDYYLPYIPEIIRLVLPVAVFTACLLTMGLMTQRLEWAALKSAGVSLMRIQRPFLVFAGVMALTVWVLDGFVIPHATTKRLAFERDYIQSGSDRVDRSTIYRQDAPERILTIHFYSPGDSIAYRVTGYEFQEGRIHHSYDVQRMRYDGHTGAWVMYDVRHTRYDSVEVVTERHTELTMEWNVQPRDLARTTNDVYQLTYPEVRQYLASLERVGAGSLEMPKVQYYGRLGYPFALITVVVMGVGVAARGIRGGTGMNLGIGLAVSFLYLAMMKLLEPFGYSGILNPFLTAILPHLFFFGVALILNMRTPR
jgi:lipopolysaccharide export system permease protein